MRGNCQETQIEARTMLLTQGGCLKVEKPGIINNDEQTLDSQLD